MRTPLKQGRLVDIRTIVQQHIGIRFCISSDDHDDEDDDDDDDDGEEDGHSGDGDDDVNEERKGDGHIDDDDDEEGREEVMKMMRMLMLKIQTSCRQLCFKVSPLAAISSQKI